MPSQFQDSEAGDVERPGLKVDRNMIAIVGVGAVRVPNDGWVDPEHFGDWHDVAVALSKLTSAPDTRSYR